MNEKYALKGSYVKKHFCMSYEIQINDDRSKHGTLKYCATIIYNWVNKKFPALELDEYIRSGSKKHHDQKVDIIYNLDELYFCLNAEHADKFVAGRIWMIEAEIIDINNKLMLAVRLAYSTPVDSNADDAIFTIPQFIKKISERVGLIDIERLEMNPIEIKDEDGVQRLYNLIIDKNRKLPVVLIAENVSHDDMVAPYMSGYLVDVSQIAKTIGLIAHVYSIPKEFLEKWQGKFYGNYGIYEGAIRTYNINFDAENDNPRKHPFTTRTRIMAASYICDDGIELTAGDAYVHILIDKIISSFVKIHIDWKKLGHKFYFVANRELLRKKEKDTNDIQQLNLDYEEEIEELLSKLDSQENEILTAWLEREELEKQLEEEKKISFNLSCRIEALKQQLLDMGQNEEIDIPDRYEDMEKWIEKYFSGKLILLDRAKRSIKKAEYADVKLVYKCLILLGTEYISLRKGSLSQSDFDQHCKELGIEVTGSIADSRAGEMGDAYYVDYCGKKVKLEKHIRKGKVTRDPKICLRIYFFWDDEGEKVVVGYLPQHLPIRTS